eukprot:gene4433-8545_t
MRPRLKRAFVALGTSIVFSSSMIAFVHWNQGKEREALHEGVVRDLERQERKRLNRIEQEQQLELQQRLEAEAQQELQTSTQ